MRYSCNTRDSASLQGTVRFYTLDFPAATLLIIVCSFPTAFIPSSFMAFPRLESFADITYMDAGNPGKPPSAVDAMLQAYAAMGIMPYQRGLSCSHLWLLLEILWQFLQILCQY